jgi:hypothetical protein
MSLDPLQYTVCNNIQMDNYANMHLLSVSQGKLSDTMRHVLGSPVAHGW